MAIQIEESDIFAFRHIGPDPEQIQKMLELAGADTLDTLIAETIPATIRVQKELNLPAVANEHRFLADLREVAGKNRVMKSYIGMGYYDCFTPGVIQRNILENPGWYTAYTPYQAEIAQGRLEALLNFQTMVLDLTGLEIANASLLDEATAAAEAMTMLYAVSRATPGKSSAKVFFASRNCHPQTLNVLKTRSQPLGIDLEIGDEEQFAFGAEVFGALLQYPDTEGNISNYGGFCRKAHDAEILVAVATDLLSLTLLKPPGEFGADVAVGSTQRFGIPMGYGGPHAAFFATRAEYRRQMPGRIIGVSVDAKGNRALRMALQTREQHIRRDKATSNICTSQVLLAVMSGMYAAYHGPVGLKAIATRIHGLTTLLAAGLETLGYRQLNAHFFDTLKISLGDSVRDSTKLHNLSVPEGMNFRDLENRNIGISLDETTSRRDIAAILKVLARACGSEPPTEASLKEMETGLEFTWPSVLVRTSPYLAHPVFNSHHSETEMLRYIKRLENRDLSLNTSMIPLGSCTMKLNATAEMIPVTWEAFARLHPFAPADQAAGYRHIFNGLETALGQITDLPGVSLQPNAGSQGEYAGLLVIRAYHKSRGEENRDVALIPTSAHGTNPASAVLAGLRVVLVRCDDSGNIDVPDLRKQAGAHAADLSCLMMTYPSTHGVFEENIQEVCRVVHEHGGQVYMDGANMNAQVGLCSPGSIGADVCHLNLHKTFCIPHGGGGPGMGPICVGSHLAPFLPGHPVVEVGGNQAIPAVSGAPWGSAAILTISYAYITMMGGENLTLATKMAILNANYIKARLQDHYPVLYQGKKGRVAHEMILDCRKFKASADIEVEDIAKRLMDYGFHAPTVSFPVPGTLMIEPTESEPLEELDRFCEAMIGIRKEIREIEEGRADRTRNVLKNAPHTAAVALSDAWDLPYSREKAVFPAPWTRENKFWPSVSRLNNAYGDKNLVCACPPIESYSES